MSTVTEKSIPGRTGRGRHYFPAEDVNRELLAPSSQHTLCPGKGKGKGKGSYYDVIVDGQRNAAAAWYRPRPSPAARKLKDHVAFWRRLTVTAARAA